ncbi:polyhydroxyalkanoate depolymerase [Tistrella mobilis]|jgi:poly(3-hydroxybutyrate) depolymerase|uniref:polyhydroxyalkanoate depolymerase n=1 Tax=Tistrella mobilis TaxID=171437 RepID=UPI0035564F8B
MLYQLHELHAATVTPIRLMAKAAQRIHSSPFNPMSYSPYGRMVAAAAEVIERVTDRYEKPAFGLDHTVIDGRTVPVVEEIVHDLTFCKLLHFRRDTEGLNDPKLLLVAPLSGHYATLLRGTVEALLPDHDVYITDWVDARMVPVFEGPFHFDDYVEYVIEFLHLLGPGTNVMAVCQPSVPVLAAVSLMNAANDPCAPATMTLMGGPIDTRESPTQVNQLAMTRPLKWFEDNVIHSVPGIYPGVMRRVYPGFVQLTGFMTMNLERHIGAHVKLYEHLVRGDGDSAEAHRSFYDEYLSVMDLPAEYYIETIDRVFQRHLLPKREMVVNGKLVDPSAITRTAVMTVEGELDDISGIGQTRASHKLCNNLPEHMHAHYEQAGVGHYGIFNGRRWREQVKPRIAAFIRAHAPA